MAYALTRERHSGVEGAWIRGRRGRLGETGGCGRRAREEWGGRRSTRGSEDSACVHRASLYGRNVALMTLVISTQTTVTHMGTKAQHALPGEWGVLPVNARVYVPRPGSHTPTPRPAHTPARLTPLPRAGWPPTNQSPSCGPSAAHAVAVPAARSQTPRTGFGQPMAPCPRMSSPVPGPQLPGSPAALATPYAPIVII